MKQLGGPVDSWLETGKKKIGGKVFASTPGPVPESFPLVLDAAPFTVP